MRLHPVILCGGKGQRLWPLSRRQRPKPFVRLGGRQSLFQQTLQRLSGAMFGAPLIVTGVDHCHAAREQLQACGINPLTMLVEPQPRDTAAAVLAAALHLHASDPDALLLISPADHLMDNTEAFHAALLQGANAASAGNIITFGLPPDRPETGYGYLLPRQLPEEAPTEEGEHPSLAQGFAQPLRRFVEKPDPQTARRLLADGQALWNAGLFLASARTLLSAFRDHAPDLLAPVRQALRRASCPEEGMLVLDADAWTGARSISFDHAVMEKVGNAMVVPLPAAITWADVGDWNAIWRLAGGFGLPGRDSGGNVVHGEVLAHDCRNSLLHAHGPDMRLVGLGLRDIAVIATADAVLVSHRDRTQELRAALAMLEAQSPAAASNCGERYVRVHRPWGWYECLARGPGFQIKRLLVHPRRALSLQSHHYRAEHWIVIAGQARATIGRKTVEVKVGKSVFVPVGECHQLANPHDEPLLLIEVQTGSYLGEDDIIRHQQEKPACTDDS